MDVQHEIEKRMKSGKPFTFASLHTNLPEVGYRMADRTIQKWRRKGWISFARNGRDTIWSLTDAGRAAIRDYLQ